MRAVMPMVFLMKAATFSACASSPLPSQLFGARFGQHRHLVHPPFARQFDDEMAAAPVGREQHFLDLGREHVDAAQDDHVVGTPGDLLHAPHAGPRRARQQPRQVAGAVADDRKALPWSAR